MCYNRHVKEINKKEKKMGKTIEIKAGDKVVYAGVTYNAVYIANDTTPYIGKNIGGGYVLVKDDEDYAEYKKWQKYWNDCDAGRA